MGGSGITGKIAGAFTKVLQGAGVMGQNVEDPLSDFNKEIKDILIVKSQ